MHLRASVWELNGLYAVMLYSSLSMKPQRQRTLRVLLTSGHALVCVCVCVCLSACVPPSFLLCWITFHDHLFGQAIFLTHLTKKADLCWLGEARQQIKASDSKSNTLSVKVSLSAPITRQKGGTRWWKGGYRTCRQGDLNCAFLSFTITWINVYTEPHVFLKICQLYTKQP